MGCDWYYFKAVSSRGSAILIRNKDIKEVFAPCSKKVTGSTKVAVSAPLEDEEKKWLLKQAEGFRMYSINDYFVLAMLKDYNIVTPPTHGVPGPYEIESEYKSVRVQIESIPEVDEPYQRLSDLARKLTPAAKKMVFPPGCYHIVTAEAVCLEVREISLEEENDKTRNQAEPEMKAASSPPECVPLDFELVVGEGEAKKSFKLNKAVLCCFFPKFEALVGDLMKSDHLELSDLNADAVELVIKAYTTRSDVAMPSRYSRLFDDVEAVKEKFGLDDQDRKRSKKNEDCQVDSAALIEPRWQDVTFVVGEKKEEVKANRAVLASRNEVLARILYGTGSISVDMDQPIEWPQFESAEGVRQVFVALLHCREAETTIPLGLVKTAKAVVEYLMESPKSLNLYYESPFEREHERGFEFFSNDDEDDGESD